MVKWLHFPPLAEFIDRSGTTRSIHGCSLMGRFEFIDRQEEIKHILDAADDDRSWQQLYLEHHQFSNAVNRCLALNGIDVDWLTPEIMEQLLFARFEDGGWKAGWLTELNQRESKNTANETIESTLPNLLALVSLNCESLKDAIELAANMPGNLLLDTIEARGELTKTPEQKADDEKARNMAALKADYANLAGK